MCVIYNKLQCWEGTLLYDLQLMGESLRKWIIESEALC